MFTFFFSLSFSLSTLQYRTNTLPLSSFLLSLLFSPCTLFATTTPFYDGRDDHSNTLFSSQVLLLPHSLLLLLLFVSHRYFSPLPLALAPSHTDSQLKTLSLSLAFSSSFLLFSSSSSHFQNWSKVHSFAEEKEDWEQTQQASLQQILCSFSLRSIFCSIDRMQFALS